MENGFVIGFVIFQLGSLHPLHSQVVGQSLQVLPRLRTLSVCCEEEEEEPENLRALRTARPTLHVHYNAMRHLAGEVA